MNSTNATATPSVSPIAFQFDAHPVRTIDRDGEIWFVASDVSDALGYRMASDMARTLDADEKGTQIVRTLGGPQELHVINESGLYSAILRSRKPEAKRFKKWVTAEVLPTLRRTGSYTTPSQTIPPRPGSRPINARQAEFCRLYLETGNATQSYIAVYGPGASWRSSQSSSHFLKRNMIQRGFLPPEAGVNVHVGEACALPTALPTQQPTLAGVMALVESIAARLPPLEGQIMPPEAPPATQPAPGQLPDLNFPWETAKPLSGSGQYLTYANSIGNPQWQSPTWQLFARLEELGVNVEGCKVEYLALRFILGRMLGYSHMQGYDLREGVAYNPHLNGDRPAKNGFPRDLFVGRDIKAPMIIS